MHPIITVKSWAHHVHMQQMHAWAENANNLLHDAAFWGLVILTALFVAAFILALNTPADWGLNDTPMYPFPIILH